MALVDKRQGQNKDYLVDKTVKAELIQHFAAQSIVGRSTSSRALAELLNEQSQLDLSERTVRWHMNKLGLDLIKKTLPELVEALKKTDK
jgi:repressor of nif and glnA expression